MKRFSIPNFFRLLKRSDHRDVYITKFFKLSLWRFFFRYQKKTESRKFVVREISPFVSRDNWIFSAFRKLVERRIRIPVRRLNSDSKPNEVRLGDGVAVGLRRNVIVVHIEIRVQINVVSYRTLPDGDLIKYRYT